MATFSLQPHRLLVYGHGPRRVASAARRIISGHGLPDTSHVIRGDRLAGRRHIGRDLRIVFDVDAALPNLGGGFVVESHAATLRPRATHRIPRSISRRPTTAKCLRSSRQNSPPTARFTLPSP